MAKRTKSSAPRSGIAIAPPARHIGLTKLRFTVNPNASNTFKVYGQNLGSGAAANKTVILSSNSHLWQQVSVANSGVNDIEITATCVKRRKHAPHALLTSSGGDDDLNVTICFDDGDLVDCTFTDVEYDG